MTKAVSEKKGLELRKLRAETEQAELEAEQERLRTIRQRRDHAEAFDYKPEARGVFHFTADVNAASCAYLADQVERYAHLNEGAPITIILHTPGGNVLDGFGLYDTLRAVASQGHHITTVVRGYAASFGAVLLQAGDRRIVGPESYVMLHEVSSMAYGKLHEQVDMVEFTKRLNSRIFALLAEKSGGKWTGAKLYNKVKATDLWLSGQDVVAYGFADEVG
jgi:ATP-dependent protease ClpP protease subunit